MAFAPDDCGLFACKIFAPELVPLCIPSAPFLGYPRLAHYMTTARREGFRSRRSRLAPAPVSLESRQVDSDAYSEGLPTT